MSGGGATPAAAPPPGAEPLTARPERLRGYLEVGLASLANGAIGVMVTYADMPATMLLCLRMAFAAAALGIVVLISGSWRDLRSPGAPLRLLGIRVLEDELHWIPEPGPPAFDDEEEHLRFADLSQAAALRRRMAASASRSNLPSYLGAKK